MASRPGKAKGIGFMEHHLEAVSGIQLVLAWASVLKKASGTEGLSSARTKSGFHPHQLL